MAKVLIFCPFNIVFNYFKYKPENVKGLGLRLHIIVRLFRLIDKFFPKSDVKRRNQEITGKLAQSAVSHNPLIWNTFD